MIVVDVNVVAYLLIAGQKTALTQEIFQLDPAWAMPHLWRHDFLNVLATFVRHGGGKIVDAEQIWQESLHLFTPYESEINMAEALRLAIQYDISAYDAQYIALTQELGVLCITEDQRLASKFPTIAQSMQTFLGSQKSN